MNTLAHAQDGQQNGKIAAPTTKGQAPLEFFEQHARKVWNSELPPDEKALKLYYISDAIHKYLRKVQIDLAERAREQDRWTQLACTRATSYLKSLADDLRQLAIKCQQKEVREKA